MTDTYELRRAGATSATYWLPRIEAAGLPSPRTVMCPVDVDGLWPLLDFQPSPEYDRVFEEVKKAAAEIGYPVFIRTDLASAKRDGPKHYRAESPDDLPLVMSMTIEDNALKDIFPEIKAFMVREFLSLDFNFRAFHGHPIAREWRYFVYGGEHRCSHFYWPDEAMQWFGTEQPEDWQQQLHDLHRLTSGEQMLLHGYAESAGLAVKDIWPDWSVDFARDTNGEWWLIDMARAHSSWHPNDCSTKESQP